MPKPEVPAKLSVDFSNVEERRESGKAAHVPPGDYLLKVLFVERKPKKGEENSFYLNWKLGIVKPEKYATAGFIYHITSLKPEALWNLRNFLEDLGIKVPKSSISIPLQQIVAKALIIGATLDDSPYNDKVTSKIQATFKKAEYEDTGSADDEEATVSDDDDDDDTATTSTDDDLEELELDDL